ncbi:N-acetylmuramoyl-L-alanine amidase [Parvularcula lutaonensis]|uniref:N-acetylmuramoyl-L-alanine amidase n=1 Tax=Parvularcula lutaonensis TaxID=491923 RepID=A0ABV7MCG1_9PROT|nr:N-acetylmuramoyl-L-alanine amidase [Parvularcula lutaonensis]GGY39916.1 N-acetylmuramoyl-L-alanine amidase [Parvularcula lutaonensis]
MIDKEWTSPNHGDRKGRDISMVVLHYTGMKTAEEALERLCDPQAEVSAHYLIEENGRLHQLVREERRAWHAGVAQWGGETDINSVSIGIELVNPGHEFGYRDFPDDQVDALIDLLEAIKDRYQIPRARIVGHSDVAPGRKEDPGEKFPWNALAAEKLAIGPWSGQMPLTLPNEEQALGQLATIGYGVETFGAEACILAFQRRFCPRRMGQGLDQETRAAIAEACEKTGACSA